MARTVGGDMSTLLEHDQLSKELKDGENKRGFGLLDVLTEGKSNVLPFTCRLHLQRLQRVSHMLFPHLQI